MKLINNLKRIFNLCCTPIDDPKSAQTQRRSVMTITLVLAAVCTITSTMNIVMGYYVMAITTLILLVGFLIATVFCYFNKRTAAMIICDLMVTFLFTYYAVSGGNYGFAILWMLLAPVFCMGFFGLPIGFTTSLYFQILLVVLFYTPLKGHVESYYTSTFLARFPVLYFAAFAGTSVFMIQRHIMMLRQLSYENELKAAVKEERERVSTISMQTILSISNAVDAKDKYTQEHSRRVSEYSCRIAKALGWDEESVEELRKIALLHDIGKIAVSDAILNKPARLTDDEFAVMKSHTTAGGEILKDLTILDNVALGAMYHHERYDGKGYPQGLSGENIPIEARIICIADSFDAMNSNRVYRPHLTPDVIHNELQKCSGTQFDPHLVEVFLPIADEIMAS